MTQSDGCPQEALGTGGDTTADFGLRLTHWTENLCIAGNAEEEKKNTNEITIGPVVTTLSGAWQ